MARGRKKKNTTGLISHGPIFEITSALFFSLNEDQYMQKLEEDEFMCVCVCGG